MSQVDGHCLGARRSRNPTARLSRREMLGSLVAVIPLLKERWPHQPQQPMIERTIPSSGENVPAIGLGTWQTFDVGSGSERAPLREVLRLFVELGGRVIDSSPMYGRSETVVGDLSAELGVADRLFVATKVWTRGRREGVQQMETSMRRLRASRVDLMQVHNLLDLDTHLATLADWKRAGRIRYTGVTHYQVRAYDELARIIGARDVDFVQLNYSLLTRDAERRILPLAQERRVAVLVNRPFEGGDAFRRVRRAPLPGWAGDIGCHSWAQVFLKYILSHPAVTCAIPATSNPDHLRDNLGAGSGALPDAALRRRMAEDVTRI